MMEQREISLEITDHVLAKLKLFGLSDAPDFLKSNFYRVLALIEDKGVKIIQRKPLQFCVCQGIILVLEMPLTHYYSYIGHGTPSHLQSVTYWWRDIGQGFPCSVENSVRMSVWMTVYKTLKQYGTQQKPNQTK